MTNNNRHIHRPESTPRDSMPVEPSNSCDSGGSNPMQHVLEQTDMTCWNRQTHAGMQAAMFLDDYTENDAGELTHDD